MTTWRYAVAAIVGLAMVASAGAEAGQARGAGKGAGKAAKAPPPKADVSPAEQTQKALSILKSDAPKAEKALACKHLAIWGSAEAVPAVAPLLADKELSSWARIALEAIPGPAADDALRDAAGKLQGRLLVGVINSIGVRRDAKSTGLLAAKLKDADPEVLASSAAALGRIGGPEAVVSLQPLLVDSSAAARAAAAEGCILCAERLLAEGKRDEAARLYDEVRKAQAPSVRVMEATRGAILARQAAGVPLLVEQLRSEDKAAFAMGLRVARELAAPEVADALVAELPKAPAARQPMLLLALADRGDAKAVPVALAAARSTSPQMRQAAMSVLERLGNASAIPVLLAAAAGDDADLARTAKAALARLSGKDVDAELSARLRDSSGKLRQVLIELAEERRLEGSLALFVKFAEDADAQVRAAAVAAIGSVGEASSAADLARLLGKTPDVAERSGIEKALIAVSGRWGEACVKALLPLAQSAEATTRITALTALAACGGADAQAAILAATADKEETVQDEAVRRLSTWPNRWPDDASITSPLLSLAKSARKPAHQVLALRGYIQFVQGARKIDADQRMAKLGAVMPLLTRAEEKRLAISALGAIGTAAALEAMVAYAGDAAVSNEACAGILALAGKPVQTVSRTQRDQALKAVIEKAKDPATRQRAEAMLKR